MDPLPYLKVLQLQRLTTAHIIISNKSLLSISCKEVPGATPAGENGFDQNLFYSHDLPARTHLTKFKTGTLVTSNWPEAAIERVAGSRDLFCLKTRPHRRPRMM